MKTNAKKPHGAVEVCLLRETVNALIYSLDAFEKAEDCALLAGYLGRYQDDRALPALKKKAIDPDLNYLEYVEVVNAIEQLGGEVPEKREFSGDPYYESLKKLG